MVKADSEFGQIKLLEKINVEASSMKESGSERPLLPDTGTVRYTEILETLSWSSRIQPGNFGF